MKFTVAAIAAFAGVAAAGYANVTTVTVPCEVTTSSVVTDYTTVCPESTTFVEGTKTYTATSGETITVTDCPCTRTHVYTTSTETVVPCSSGVPVLPSNATWSPSESPKETETAPVVPEETTKSNVTIPTVAPANGAAKVGVSGAVAGVLAAAVYFL